MGAESTFFGLKSEQDLENRAVQPSPKIPRSTPWDVTQPLPIMI